MSQGCVWLAGSQCCTQGLASALTPVPFTFADRGTSTCSASRGHPEPAAEFLPQLQGEEITSAGLCSWPGMEPSSTALGKTKGNAAGWHGVTEPWGW